MKAPFKGNKEARVSKILNHLRRAEAVLEAWDRYDSEDLDLIESDTQAALSRIRILFAAIDPDTGEIREDFAAKEETPEKHEHCEEHPCEECVSNMVDAAEARLGGER